MIKIQDVLDFAAAGLAIIPIKADGSKSPAIPSWKDYQSQAPNQSELESWFSGQHKHAGAAMLCGKVSGGVEVLDFDQDAETIYPAWCKLVGDILCFLPVVETPSGGYHVFYRCNRITGNHKIAARPSKKAGKVETLIESRGEGGYVVACISPANVHALSYPYVQVAGPVLPEIPRISSVERKALWAAGATFDKKGIREQAIQKLIRCAKPCPHGPSNGTTKPWDDFNRRGDWHGVLRRHGWTSSDGIHWRHPEAKSSNGHSATLREASTGDLVLCVFTTSTPLEAEQSHSLYSVFATLEHGGDFSAAAKDLRRQGYGR